MDEAVESLKKSAVDGRRRRFSSMVSVGPNGKRHNACVVTDHKA